ncbi:MAG: XdhC family protein [Burkholderiales bacterium]|nr:XdhC family protein [Burkholderiales bacterium]MCW5604326.1 XdhC family protein [Burkholderiales bacterium]
MSDLHKIVDTIRAIRGQGRRGVLATVVDVEGSAYRLPGAHMLIDGTEWAAGSISGGCLESDVIARAAEVAAADSPAMVTYDTTGDDDILFGVGLGCRGVIRILIEPVADVPGPADLAAFAERCLRSGRGGIAATIIGGAGAPIGRRLLCSGHTVVVADIDDPELLQAVKARALAWYAETAGLAAVETARGTVTVFFEPVTPPVPLVVFGAGHDAIPLVRCAKSLGWHVTVVDHRPDYVRQERFPEADAVLLSGAERIPGRVTMGPQTLTMVMTHNYLRDRDLTALLLRSPVRYIGLLGPRKRTLQLLEDIRTSDGPAALAGLERLYGPAGLDIGAESPEAVALSVVSEMCAVTEGRPPMHLRNKRGAIHAREPVAPENGRRPGMPWEGSDDRQPDLTCPA